MLGALAATLWLERKLAHDPAYVYLARTDAAEWIAYDYAPRLDAYPPETNTTWFRTSFGSTRTLQEAELKLVALEDASVYVDGKPIHHEDGGTSANWKIPRGIALREFAAHGRQHELSVRVSRRGGHPAMKAECTALGIATDDTWSASLDGVNWSPAITLTGKPKPTAESRSVMPVRQALPHALIPVLIGFAAGVSLTVVSRRAGLVAVSLHYFATPERFRFVVLAIASILFLNNAIRFPGLTGFDAQHHVDYIRFILERDALPLASDGWQMFQTPLFYVVAAGPYALGNALFGETAAILSVRLIVFLSALGLIEVTYRAARTVWPGDDFAQRVATIVAAAMPMNIYMAHGVGNECFAAMLTARAILFALEYAADESRSVRALLLVGVSLAFAILAKVTAVLLLPPVLLLIGVRAYRSDLLRIAKLRTVAIHSAAFLTPVALLTTWYFARNWLRLGSLVATGWNPERGMAWWQDPSYRNWAQLASFGEALSYPIHSGMGSLWDGLYSTFWLDGLVSAVDESWRPLWNMPYMLSTAWFAIPMTIAILFGLLVTARRVWANVAPVELFVLASIAVYMTAFVMLYLQLPIYTTVKASYLLGLIPCIAICFVNGVSILRNSRIGSRLIHGYLGAWCALTIAAYWIGS